MQTVIVKCPPNWTNKNNLLHLSSSQNLSLRSLNRHIFNNKLQACCIFFEKLIMANLHRRVAAQVLLPVDLWWLKHFWPASFLFYPFNRWKPYSCCSQLYPQSPHPSDPWGPTLTHHTFQQKHNQGFVVLIFWTLRRGNLLHTYTWLTLSLQI